MLTRKNLDELSPASRDFYERAYLKLSFSLIFASFGMLFLGLCSCVGGESSYNQYIVNGRADDDGKYSALVSGYGFSSFAFIIASLLSFAVAIYISPFVASKNEGNILRTPQDIEQYDGSTNSAGGIKPYDGRQAPVAEPVYASPVHNHGQSAPQYNEKDV